MLRPGLSLIALACLAACGSQRANTPPPSAEPPPPAQHASTQAKQSESIATVERALVLTQDPGARAELLFRLAGLYLDLAQECDRARRELEDRMATEPPEQTDRLVRQAVEAGACAGPSRKKATQILARLIKECPKNPRADEHLFLLASTLMDLGEPQTAFRMWKQLVKQHPNSRYVPDAYLAFAEWYFNQARLDRAMQAYQKVLQFKDSPLAPYARYKLAWCHFNLTEFDKALDGFASLARGDTQLAKEARKDAVMAFAHVGEPTQAEAFFSKLAPGQDLVLLSRLASIWGEDGRYADAIAIDRILIPRMVCDPAQLMVQARLLRSQTAIHNNQKTTEEAERLVQLIRAQQACAETPDMAARRAGARATQRADAREALARLADGWQREQQATRDYGLTPLIARLRAALESLNRM